MNVFPSIDEVHEMLDEIAEEIPKDFFKELNGGIILLREHKIHPESKTDNKLYVKGEYHKNVTGRQIKIYYGSFKRIYKGASRTRLYRELQATLLHEFTHHLESLAGEKGLEIKDAHYLQKYKDK